MLMMKRVIVFILVLTLAACEESSPAKAASPATESAPQADASPDPLAVDTYDNSPSESATDRMDQTFSEIEAQTGFKIFDDPWTGDLDVMAEQRIIRVLTVYGLGRYFLDGPQQKGLTYELFKMFEEFVNEKFGAKHLRIHVIFIPVARDELIPGLISGRGDIVAAGLTITPERDEMIDFSNPASRPLSEVLVTGPSAPKINTLDGLAGHTIYVRKSSSYRASLDALNLRFKQQGLEEIRFPKELIRPVHLIPCGESALCVNTMAKHVFLCAPVWSTRCRQRVWECTPNGSNPSDDPQGCRFEPHLCSPLSG